MPVTLEMADKRVMVLTLTAPWNVGELMAVYPEEQKIYDAATDKVFAIVNLTNMGNIPAGALRARVSPQVTHPMSGQVCIVGANAVARTMAETVFKLTRFNRIMFFKTEAEAWAFLRPQLEKDEKAMQP